MNIIDQQGTLFITLFVYGTDGRPTWYVASEVLRVTGTSRSTGALYATTGPYFGGTFAGAVNVRQVGTISVTINTYANTGTVTYSVDGVSVTKTIERQSWKSLSPAGTFYGAIDAATGCAITGLSTSPDAVTITSVVSGSNLTMTMTGAAAGTLVMTAPLTQYGSIYFGTGTLRVGTTTYTATLNDYSIDDDGISGNIAITGSGCTAQARFAAVRPR